MTTIQKNNAKSSPSLNGAAKKPAVAKPAGAPQKEAKKDAKLSPTQKATKRLGAVTKRLAALTKLVSGWDAKLDVAVGEVKDALESAALAVTALPKDFVPTGKRKGGGGTALAAGTLVNVTDKAKDAYDGILEEGEFVGLKVLVVKGTKVRCKTSGGTIIALPRAHVAPVKEVDA